MTLTEFLLARIAEDEARLPEWFSGIHSEWIPIERIKAECEAKRWIVEAHPQRDNDGLGCETCDWQPWWPGTFREPCPTLRLLALPYADHPDFDPEWKP